MEKLERHARLKQLYNSGLMAITLLILQGFITTGQLDIPETIAIFSFAIAIPCLAGTIAIDFLIGEDDNTIERKTEQQFTRIWYTGMICAFIGICATFWHISLLAGIAFLFASIFISGVVSKFALRDIMKTIDTLQHTKSNQENTPYPSEKLKH